MGCWFIDELDEEGFECRDDFAEFADEQALIVGAGCDRFAEVGFIGGGFEFDDRPACGGILRLDLGGFAIGDAGDACQDAEAMGNSCAWVGADLDDVFGWAGR